MPGYGWMALGLVMGYGLAWWALGRRLWEDVTALERRVAQLEERMPEMATPRLRPVGRA